MRDHGTFLDSLTPESREQALAFAEKTATGEWQARLDPEGEPLAAIRVLCERWHAGELSDREFALSVVVDLGGVGEEPLDAWVSALGNPEGSRPKRERLADFVVGIDVEQGPGLAVLRGLVTELGAVADRLEAALPAEPSAAVLGAGEGAQIGTTKHWLAVHEIGPDGEVDERVRIPEAWRDQARALLGQGSILVLVEATAFDPSKMRVIGE